MARWNGNSNINLVYSLLGSYGAKSSREIKTITGLTIDQVKYALQELKYSGAIELCEDRISYKQITSKLADLMVRKAWDNRLKPMLAECIAVDDYLG